MNPLIVIPARGGSKGIPGKNIKHLGGKPLIYYSIDVARQIVKDENICVSTDDLEIIKIVNEINLSVPFVRPKDLATDTAGSQDVLLHAIDFYKKNGKEFDTLILLQPTSPFRKASMILEAMSIMGPNVDMVVSVTDSKSNPYYNLFEEDESKNLKQSKPGNFLRRQDCPKVYEMNGSIYIINTESLRHMSMNEFPVIKRYSMDSVYSIDIDEPLDWIICESILKSGILK